MVSATETAFVYGKITPAALEQLRARIGKTFPVDEPYIRHINVDSVRHICRAIGDMNPLYVGHGSGDDKNLQVPPSIFYAVAWGSWDLRKGEGLPGVHALHAGDRWWYYRPVGLGDEITAVKRLIKADLMEGRLAGKNMLMQVREIDFSNQRGELVARQHMQFIRAERHESKKRGKNADAAPATYTPEEIDDIDARMLAEEPRGPVPRYWEDVQVGDAIDSVVKGPLTVSDMISWLQGVGSPHVRSGKYWAEYRSQHPKVSVPDPVSGIPLPVERVHWDNFMAAEAGMPAAYDYGSQRGAYATYLITNWMGDLGRLTELSVQYRGMCFLGDLMTLSGTVTKKWREGSKALVEITIQTINQRGQDIMPGFAHVALPMQPQPRSAANSD